MGRSQRTGRSQHQILGVVHDDPEVTPSDEVATTPASSWTIASNPRATSGLQEIGGEYAVATHQGPYVSLGETYVRICGQWLPSSGRELRSAATVEIYRNSPQDTRPEELLTDIHLPLLKA